MEKESEVSFCCLELKYCERCGALWLRQAGGQESYCGVCFQEMQDLPEVKKRAKNRRAAHRNKRQRLDVQAVAEQSTVVAGSSLETVSFLYQGGGA